jgi:hypothetical protein
MKRVASKSAADVLVSALLQWRLADACPLAAEAIGDIQLYLLMMITR